MSRVLAIGATGFIGSRVVRCLIDAGHDVAVLHRGETDRGLPLAAHRIHGNRDALAEALPRARRFGPDVVLDVIPYTERQARALLEAFRGRVRRIVAVGSADVYRNYDGFRGRASAAPPDAVPLAEEAPLRETRYPYRGSGLPFTWADDYDKLLVERVVMGTNAPAGTILRLPAVYGPDDPQRRLRLYLRRMDDGRPAVLLERAQAEWRWTRGYVDNVAAAIALAVSSEDAAGRLYNVGEEPARTEREWVEAIGAAAGWHGRVVEVPAEALPAPLRQPFDFRYALATDTHRIREELAYVEPVDRREALRRTVAWERSQPDVAGESDYSGVYRDEDAVLARITPAMTS